MCTPDNAPPACSSPCHPSHEHAGGAACLSSRTALPPENRQRLSQIMARVIARHSLSSPAGGAR